MITSAHITLTGSTGGASPAPTLMLFSNEFEADLRLLERYILSSTGKPRGDDIRILWALPDPRIALGYTEFSRAEAAENQARNRASGGIEVLIVRDAPGAMERYSLWLDSFYADWLGALGQEPPPADADRVAPITRLSIDRARRYREAGQTDEAVRVLLDGLTLATRPDGSFTRLASYALHEAALLAEACGLIEAWDYFETVALTIYPNCHDALIGLALRAQDDPEQAVRLFGRAYAIRSRPEDLRLFALTLTRSGKQPFTDAHQAIIACAAETDLDSPLFRDANDVAWNIPPDEVLAHLRALAAQ